jgi:hypothetical protein
VAERVSEMAAFDKRLTRVEYMLWLVIASQAPSIIEAAPRLIASAQAAWGM